MKEKWCKRQCGKIRCLYFSSKRLFVLYRKEDAIKHGYHIKIRYPCYLSIHLPY